MTPSGNDIRLEDNPDFKRLKEDFERLKRDFDDLKIREDTRPRPEEALPFSHGHNLAPFVPNVETTDTEEAVGSGTPTDTTLSTERTVNGWRVRKMDEDSDYATGSGTITIPKDGTDGEYAGLLPTGAAVAVRIQGAAGASNHLEWMQLQVRGKMAAAIVEGGVYVVTRWETGVDTNSFTTVEADRSLDPGAVWYGILSVNVAGDTITLTNYQECMPL